MCRYVESIRSLTKDGKLPSFPRTLHILFGPDEEILGIDGAKALIEHPECFNKLARIGDVLVTSSSKSPRFFHSSQFYQTFEFLTLLGLSSIFYMAVIVRMVQSVSP